MTLPPGRAAPRVAAAGAVLLLVAGGAVGCSDDGDDEGGAGEAGSAVTGTFVPSSTGDRCTDPTGDLDLPVGVTADQPGLAGIDLVEAAAVPADDVLEITVTTAGAIDAAPAAAYVVAQGEPLGALSFELRMARGPEGWRSTLVTWPGGAEQRQFVAVTPTVDGATLTASLPLAGLPPVAQAMQFGTAASVGDAVVIDDCDSLTPG